MFNFIDIKPSIYLLKIHIKNVIKYLLILKISCGYRVKDIEKIISLKKRQKLSEILK